MEAYERISAEYTRAVNAVKRPLPALAAAKLLEMEEHYGLGKNDAYRKKHDELLECEGFENYEAMLYVAVNFVQDKIRGDENFVPEWMQE